MLFENSIALCAAHVLVAVSVSVLRLGLREIFWETKMLQAILYSEQIVFIIHLNESCFDVQTGNSIWH